MSQDLSTSDVRKLLELAQDGALMEDTDLLAEALAELLRVRDAEPKPAVLFCPKCSELHVDKVEEDGTDWTKRRHRKHLCHNKECGHVWQPFDFPTYGVQLPAPLNQLHEMLHKLHKEGVSAPLSYVTNEGLVLVPPEVRKKLHLEDGGGVVFIPDKHGFYHLATDDQFLGMFEPRK